MPQFGKLQKRLLFPIVLRDALLETLTQDDDKVESTLL